MSYDAYSITYATTVEAALANVRSTEASELPGFPGMTEENSLVSFSRNGLLECNLRLMLDQLALPQLAYFHSWDQVITSKSAPFAETLAGKSLEAAATAIRAALLALRKDPAPCFRVDEKYVARASEVEIVRALAEEWPTSLDQARARVAKAEDGDTFQDMIAFLQAHTLLLEHAHGSGRAISYFVSP